MSGQHWSYKVAFETAWLDLPFMVAPKNDTIVNCRLIAVKLICLLTATWAGVSVLDKPAFCQMSSASSKRHAICFVTVPCVDAAGVL